MTASWHAGRIKRVIFEPYRLIAEQRKFVVRTLVTFAAFSAVVEISVNNVGDTDIPVFTGQFAIIVFLFFSSIYFGSFYHKNVVAKSKYKIRILSILSFLFFIFILNSIIQLLFIYYHFNSVFAGLIWITSPLVLIFNAVNFSIFLLVVMVDYKNRV